MYELAQDYAQDASEIPFEVLVPVERPAFIPENPREDMGKLLELQPSQKARLKKYLKNRLGEWKTDTADLAQRLIDDNELVEGVIAETDWPWIGASNVHIPIAEMYMEVYYSIEKRSLLGADIIWYPETDEVGEIVDVLTSVGDAVNYYARNRWNVEDALAKVFWTTNRDGLGVIQATWEERTEPAKDILAFRSADEFVEEFPDAESAGLTEEEYQQAVAYIAQTADEFEPVEIPMTYERIVYQGVKCEVVELINFVRIPTNIEHIKDPNCRGYGKRYYVRSETLREKARQDVYYTDAVKSILQKKSKNQKNTMVTDSLRWIDGITDSNTDNFELYELVVRGHLDGTKVLDTKIGEEREAREGKFLVTYSEEHDELLQVAEYFYRVDFYALFKIGDRPGRIQGPSIPGKVRDINDEIDTQHNQRINSRTIAMVPSFKAQTGIKKTFDPSAEENRFRPGVVFWLENFEAFEQFKVQPTELGESMAEEKNDMSILDLLLGSPVALFSGAAPTGDPDAPGNKTAMLISQGNLRMDDPLDELRKGVEELGDICISHLYQFGENLIRYMKDVEQDGQIVRQLGFLHRRYLRKGIKMKMRGVTVAQNPDAEMMKGFNLHGMLMKSSPIYAQNPQAQHETLREALRRGRVANRAKILPSPEEVEAMQVQIQKKAMAEMVLEKALADREAAATEQKERMAAAKNQLSTTKTAEQLATAGLGA